ncbi:hypothetical protein ACFVYD_30130 [Streptomyces sp. NPDC058301]|uniref:hypothetical protein n=1 Tax=Streptomyces sp. NPDC058301 TaxID=3346436 RepID=UPI0036EDDEAB
MIISVSMSGGSKKPAPAKSAATPPSASRETPSPTTSPSPQSTRPATTVNGDGQYRIGTDIQAGTYRTDGPSDSSLPNCYWERDRDAKGELNSIIANGNPTGSAVVTILPADKLFKTQGCKEWIKVG